MINWYKQQNLFIKIIIPLFIVAILVLVFLNVKCYNGPEKNCVFINEKANLHDEYYITVQDAYVLDAIQVYKNENDSVKSEIIGTSEHYVSVEILIERQQVANPAEDHKLDLDDFKLKDHTGIQISNINLFSNKDGVALSTKEFKTKTPIADYSWLGKNLNSGQQKTMTLYYSFSKDYSPDNSIMVLEADFFWGIKGHKAGTDLLLAYRKTSD